MGRATAVLMTASASLRFSVLAALMSGLFELRKAVMSATLLKSAGMDKVTQHTTEESETGEDLESRKCGLGV